MYLFDFFKKTFYNNIQEFEIYLINNQDECLKNDYFIEIISEA